MITTALVGNTFSNLQNSNTDRDAFPALFISRHFVIWILNAGQVVITIAIDQTSSTP